MPSALPSPLRVAIIGGGPGGLGTAIALSSLPDISISIFEQARELREIGAGIQIGLNCWKVLELLGAADDVKGNIKAQALHRNGLTGELVSSPKPSTLPLKYQSQRVRRTRLQSALISKVPKGIIQLKKRLVSLEDLDEGGVRLVFEDGTVTTADLVVGGDGIRSVVREHIFPNHTIRFTGTTIWRVLIPLASVSHIPELSSLDTTWWHGPKGHVYFAGVDDPSETPAEEQMFEIAARHVVDPETAIGKRYSWGVPATKERVEAHFKDYDQRVQEALSQTPEGQWKEFSAFAGPRLETLTAWNKVVLIGDASHPLSGAFGSGAAFALQDAWILARALKHTRVTGKPLAQALRVFDHVRSPYYLRMYEHLDQVKKRMQEGQAGDRGFEDVLRAKVATFGGDKLALGWIYRSDIEEVWEEYLRTENDA